MWVKDIPKNRPEEKQFNKDNILTSLARTPNLGYDAKGTASNHGEEHDDFECLQVVIVVIIMFIFVIIVIVMQVMVIQLSMVIMIVV